MTDELWRLDATELAQLIRLGSTSRREPTESCMARSTMGRKAAVSFSVVFVLK